VGGAQRQGSQKNQREGGGGKKGRDAVKEKKGPNAKAPTRGRKKGEFGLLTSRNMPDQGGGKRDALRWEDIGSINRKGDNCIRYTRDRKKGAR